MKKENSLPLAKGQVWKTQAAAIEILGLGKRLIHYRIIKHLGPKRASVQISAIEAMLNYLKVNRAELANDGAAA